MWKFLLILFIIGYIFYKLGNFVFKVLLGRAVYQQQKEQRRQKRKQSYNGINIEYDPNSKKTKKRSAANYKGGEYVDYEELK